MHTSRRLVPTYLVVVTLISLCLLPFTTASTIFWVSNPADVYQNLNRDLSPESCPAYVGNSDAYGFGIRLGIYLQWITSVTIKWVFPTHEHLRDVLNENAIFLLSIFVATIVLAATGDPKPHAVDIIILEHIFFGSIYTVFFDGHVIDNLEQISSFWGILFKWAMPVGMSSLSIWFWARGLFDLQPICGGTTAFLFAPLNASGRVRTAFLVFACANMLIWASALSGTFYDRMDHLVQVEKKYRAAQRETGTPTTDYPQSLERYNFSTLWREWCVPMKEYEEHYYSLNNFREMVQAIFLARDPPSAPSGLMATTTTLRSMLESSGLHVSEGPLKHMVGFLEGMERFLGQFDMSNPAVRERTERKLREFFNSLNEEEQRSTGPQDKKKTSPFRRFCGKVLAAFLPPPQPSSKTEDWSKFKRNWAKYASKVFNTFMLIYSIIAIELLIHFNNIVSVYDLGSTGQIIPFVIGLATFWRTIVVIVTDLIEKRDEEENARMTRNDEEHDLPGMKSGGDMENGDLAKAGDVIATGAIDADTDAIQPSSNPNQNT